MNFLKEIFQFNKSNPSFDNLSNRNILIVGGSSGIGFALAQLLKENDSNVFVAARRGSLLEKEFLKENVYQIDVTNSDEINYLFEDIATPPLPNLPQPTVNTQANVQNVDPTTNLTSTETALLSPEEQVIRQRLRRT